MARVLVVDDEPALQHLLRFNFQAEGQEVVTAGTGNEALEIAWSNPPDLVIVDVTLPDIDGYAVTRALKGDSRTAKIPVVLISGRAGEADVRAGMEAGASEYFTKPFDQMKLVEKVRALLSEG